MRRMIGRLRRRRRPRETRRRREKRKAEGVGEKEEERGGLSRESDCMRPLELCCGITSFADLGYIQGSNQKA